MPILHSPVGSIFTIQSRIDWDRYLDFKNLSIQYINSDLSGDLNIRNWNNNNLLAYDFDLHSEKLRRNDLFKLEERKKDLENYALQSDELFSLEQERKILENQLQTLMNEAQVKTHLIGNIETKTIKPKTQLTILLGIIMGFITGILLAFIRNFIKNYRESEA